MNNKNQISIFIVEDNKVFALALKADIESAFLDMPIRINIFETGEKCMEKFNEEMPQIVFLDYHLDSNDADAMDGIKVLDLIKLTNKETNVVMLSRDDHYEIALTSFNHGASDYIVKTDTQFRKIIFSLFNLFNMIEANSDTRKYKKLLKLTTLGFVILIGALFVIKLLHPILLK